MGALLVVPLAAHPAQAQGPGPGWTAAHELHQEGIYQWLRNGGAAPPGPCNAVCSGLNAAELRAADKPSVKARVHRGLLKIRQAAGSMPKIPRQWPKIPYHKGAGAATAGASAQIMGGVTTFAVGWQIGSAINAKVFKFNIPMVTQYQPGAGSWNIDSPYIKIEAVTWPDDPAHSRNVFNFGNAHVHTGTGALGSAPGAWVTEQTGTWWRVVNNEYTVSPDNQPSAPSSAFYSAQEYGTRNESGTTLCTADAARLIDYAIEPETPWVNYRGWYNRTYSMQPPCGAGTNQETRLMAQGAAAPIKDFQFTPGEPFNPNDPVHENATVTSTAPTPDEATLRQNARQMIEHDQGANDPNVETAKEFIESNLPGSDKIDPTENQVLVPDCAGQTWVTCKTELEDAGLVPVRTIVTGPEINVEKAAGAVISTNPAAGARADTESTIQVRTNPDADKMPRIVPDPFYGETAELYRDRLTELGLLGEIEILSETMADPMKGPGVVVRTRPEPKTALPPGGTVRIYTNPPTMPPIGPTPPGETPTIDLPAIDLAPLKEAQPCNVFPFGVPCWAISQLSNLTADGACPAGKIPFGSDQLKIDKEMNVSLCSIKPAVDIVRPVILFGAAIALAFAFFSYASGSAGRSGSGDD